jgi:hypothetical protein
MELMKHHWSSRLVRSDTRAEFGKPKEKIRSCSLEVEESDTQSGGSAPIGRFLDICFGSFRQPVIQEEQSRIHFFIERLDSVALPNFLHLVFLVA